VTATSYLGPLADGILIAFLAVTLVYVYRLHRRLGQLRAERASFEKLIADFSQSTQQATQSMVMIRQAADIAGKDLQNRIEHGQQVIAENRKAADDLKMLIGRAGASADQLEDAIAKSRPVAPPRIEPKPTATPASAVGAQPAKLGPEAEAVLSALSGIR
jgi:hypothetical protein